MESPTLHFPFARNPSNFFCPPAQDWLRERSRRLGRKKGVSQSPQEPSSLLLERSPSLTRFCFFYSAVKGKVRNGELVQKVKALPLQA